MVISSVGGRIAAKYSKRSKIKIFHLKFMKAQRLRRNELCNLNTVQRWEMEYNVRDSNEQCG